MSVVVVPSNWVGIPHPAGRLANTLLSVAVAGIADPTRFRKGRQYATDGAVTRLEVDHGIVRAEVMGSRDMPYDVVVRVATIEAPPADTPDALRMLMTRLAPEVDDISAHCTCPSWDGTCKHAVAALLVLAAHLIERPELLVLWRTSDGVAPDRPATGAPARAATPRPEAPPDPWASVEWLTFLGTEPPQVTDLPVEPVRVRRVAFGTADLGEVVRSALAVFQHRER